MPACPYVHGGKLYVLAVDIPPPNYYPITRRFELQEGSDQWAEQTALEFCCLGNIVEFGGKLYGSGYGFRLGDSRYRYTSVRSSDDGGQSWDSVIQLCNATAEPRLAVFHGELCCAFVTPTLHLGMIESGDGVRWSKEPEEYGAWEINLPPSLVVYASNLFCGFQPGPLNNSDLRITWCQQDD